MMSNFKNTFNQLKKERELSNKQVASFTGVKIKEVKKWETGTSFPTDIKVVNALEGILGTEITKSLEGFKTKENRSSSLIGSEDEIFKVNNEKLEVSNTRIDRLRNIFQRETQPNNDFNYDSDFEISFDNQALPKRAIVNEENNSEQPYLYDDKQLGFYISRNIKTVGLLSILGVVIISFFRLFWESFNLFINNIL